MGRSHTTAFRLSGIRARGDAAESDVAMASNDNKKKARRLQQENPGMKYTEALRRVEAGDESFDPAVAPTPRARSRWATKGSRRRLAGSSG